MTATIETLKATKNRLAHESSEAWAKLVSDYAAGVEREPLEVVHTLATLGRTVDDLEAAANLTDQRRECVARVAEAAKVQAELNQLEAEQLRLRAEEDARRVQFENAQAQRFERVKSLRKRVLKNENDRAWLCAHPKPEVAAEEARLLAERVRLLNAIHVQKELVASTEVELRGIRRNFESAEAGIEKLPNNVNTRNEHGRWRLAVAKAESSLASHRERLAGLQQQVVSVNEKFEALQLRKLEA